MSCRVFFPPTPFNTLSFIENCRETRNINQAINSPDYANEMPGAFVSQNSCSPRRMLWPLPSSALPAQTGALGPAWCSSHQGTLPVIAVPAVPRRTGATRPAARQRNRGGAEAKETPGPANEPGGLHQLAPPPESQGEERDKNEIKNLPNKMLCQLGWREGTRAAAISIHVEENHDNVVDAEENLGCRNWGSLGTHCPWAAALHLTAVLFPPFIHRAQTGTGTQGCPAGQQLAMRCLKPRCSFCFVYCVHSETHGFKCTLKILQRDRKWQLSTSKKKSQARNKHEGALWWRNSSVSCLWWLIESLHVIKLYRITPPHTHRGGKVKLVESEKTSD